MGYWLETDAFGDDPRWEVLAGGRPAMVDALQAAYCRLKARASHLLSNGYLTELAAVRECHGRRTVLAKLTERVLDEPPFLHRPGDECDCLGDVWTAGYAYRIHNYLKRNPSRAEYNRNRAQRADLRSPELKARVYARDGGCCRYCRSGPLSPKAVRARDRRKVLTYDHVDPDAPAGPGAGNFVVCCGACGEYKGHRTPYEADMQLLPAPAGAEAAAWAARGLALFDRHDQMPDHRPITDESATDHRHDADRITDPVSDPISDTVADRDPDPTGQVHPTNGRSAAETAPINAREGPGSGRVGDHAVTPTAGAPRRSGQPARDPADPDVYHRRSRASPPPDPDYQWPPGAVPATEVRRPADEEVPHARDP